MTPVKPLPPEALYTTCSLENLKFETTSDLEEVVEFVGQDRAVKAIDLGISIQRHGYNIFALGPSGTGKYTLVDKLVSAQAATEPAPDDWCYVNNFQQPYMPKALRLPQGMGKQLQRDMERLVEELRTALSSAFESEEYQTRRRVLEEEFQERQQESLKEIQELAKERGLTLLRTPAGLAFAPVKDGNVLPPEEFQRLTEEEQQRIQAEVEALQEQLQKVLFQVPHWEREFRQRLREMNVEVADFVLNDLFGELNNTYKDLPDVISYLEAVRADVSENLDAFLGGPGRGAQQPGQPPVPDGVPIPDAFRKSSALRRYEVNVLVDSSEETGAPVIYESNPSYLNLVGRVEQMAMMGALVTDFTLIKPGVLHRANGGYLILDALRVLTSPYAWEGLKRALQFKQIRIESPTQMLSLTSTISLEPEPIPLDIKVVLMGERLLYYMLAQADPDFDQLFKVAADFDDEFVRSEETTPLYARLIATVVRRQDLRPFDHSAVCRVIEQASRLVSDSERVTARMQSIVDLLEESDHWAGHVGAEIVTAEHVQMAVDAQIYRMNRVAQRMKEEILRETLMIDTEGEVIGQINALSVIQFGNFAFGRPTRVTATVRMGSGEVVDIEREAEMGGPIHSKGVLILSSLIRSRYAA